MHGSMEMAEAVEGAAVMGGILAREPEGGMQLFFASRSIGALLCE
jgi:hypothetical protein